jgi:hypothetical protein
VNAEERSELLDKVKDLVGEHCNGFVFIADIEADEYEEGAHESVMVGVWNGGVTLCTGLLHRAVVQMDRQNGMFSEEES